MGNSNLKLLTHWVFTAFCDSSHARSTGSDPKPTEDSGNLSALGNHPTALNNPWTKLTFPDPWAAEDMQDETQPSGRKELLQLQDLSENGNWLHLGEDVSVLGTQRERELAGSFLLSLPNSPLN